MIKISLKESPLVEERCLSIPRPRVNNEFSYLLLTGKNGNQVLLRAVPAVVENQTDFLVNTKTIDLLGEDTQAEKPVVSTLGCDPEFFILKDNKSVPAMLYLPFVGKVGSDGWMGEYRPNYSTTAYGLLRELYSCIKYTRPKLVRSHGSDLCSRLKLYAGSWDGNYPAGFHLHFGFHERITRTANRAAKLIRNAFIEAMDFYIGIPSMLADYDTPRRRNGKHSYGKLGDYRMTPCTIEYRVPGGIFLRSPQAVLDLFSSSLEVYGKIIQLAFDYLRLKHVSLFSLERSLNSMRRLNRAALQEISKLNRHRDILRQVELVEKFAQESGLSLPMLGNIDHIMELSEMSPDFERTWKDFFGDIERNPDVQGNYSSF